MPIRYQSGNEDVFELCDYWGSLTPVPQLKPDIYRVTLCIVVLDYTLQCSCQLVDVQGDFLACVQVLHDDQNCETTEHVKEVSQNIGAETDKERTRQRAYPATAGQRTCLARAVTAEP